MVNRKEQTKGESKMNDKTNVSDAEMVEISNSAQQNEHKGKALAIPLKRHEKMIGVEKPYVEKYVDELELDEKLGLDIQTSYTQDSLLKEDIDDLTNSRDYVPVTEKAIKKLFKFGMLKKKCFLNNIKEALSCVPEVFGILLVGIVATLATSLLTASFFNAVGKVMQFTLVGGIVLSAIVAIVGIAWTIACFREGVSFDFIKVKLRNENVTQTRIRLPRGAKLKLLEAKESKIFDSFHISYPEAYVEHKEIKIPEMSVDPAILGRTSDGQLFMICYWDIQKDVDKTVEKIEILKRFKVS